MKPEELLADSPERDEEFDASEFSGPLEWYWHFSQRGDFQTDSEQLKVLERLQQLFEELVVLFLGVHKLPQQHQHFLAHRVAVKSPSGGRISRHIDGAKEGSNARIMRHRLFLR